MDGRRARKLTLCGGIFLSSLGCTRTTYPDAMGIGQPAQPNGGMLAHKPVWGGGSSPTGAAGPTGMPDEVASTKPRKPGEGLQPDTEVVIANTLVASATSENPPSDRDAILDRARTAYERALKKEPKNQGALLGLARMYAKLGDRDRADDTFRKYLAIYPKDTAVLNEIAFAHARAMDFPRAITWCELALKQDPENRAVRKTMAFCMAWSGRWEDAFAIFCQIMPEAQARYNMARVLQDLNYADASRQQLELALRTDPSNAPARELLAELGQSPGQNGIRQASGTSP